jgi:GT2 family glycosyltransferase
MATPTASVVVVSYNGAHLLPRCLDALRTQKPPDGGMEIVVVDNASTDGTAGLLAARYPEIRLVEAGQNTGFSGGVALGLEQTTAPLVVLVNNDAVAASGFLSALVEPFSKPTVGAVCAKVLLADGRGVNSVGAEIIADGYARDRGWLQPDDGRYDTPAEVFVGSGCALALRREAVDDAGGIDRSYFLYYEDTDLTWRLRLRGWAVVTAPDAVISHEHSATVGRGSSLHTFYDERNRLITLVKDASAGLVLKALVLQPVTTLYIAWREVQSARTERRAPNTRLLRARLRASAGFVRLLPHAWRERRRIGRRALVPRRELERRWLVRR